MSFFYTIRDIFVTTYLICHIIIHNMLQLANHDFHGIPSKYIVIKEVQSVPVDLKKS